MSCSDYPTAQTAKTFKLDAETTNEVVTLEQDRTSAASDGKTKKTFWGIENDATLQRENIEALAEAQRDNLESTFTAQFAYKRIGNISLYVGNSLPEVDKLNSYQYPDDSGDWYGPVQDQVFPITIPSDPSGDDGWALVNAASQDWVKISVGNKNELSNSNFLIPSPDAITHPNATPESYAAGTQIFSNVYAGSSGCTVTFINGRVNCSAGSYEYRVANTGGLERVPVFTSSVSDYDGIPKETGVSHALVSDEYVVTVTPAAGEVFSVKLEQGSIATRHEAETPKGQGYSFNSVGDMVNTNPPAGSKCSSGSGKWIKVLSTQGLSSFKPLGKVFADDFGLSSSDVQNAATYCIDNLVDMTASKSSSFSFNSTVLLKNQGAFGKSLELSLGGAAITMTADVTTFESAYDNGGVLTSNIGTPEDSHMTFGVKLYGFTIESAVGTLNEPSLRIQDWHQGTEMDEVINKVSRQVLRSYNNYYCKFGSIVTLTSALTSGARFYFLGSHNLNDIRHLVATNSGFGYLFNGPTTATSMKHMSFEGMSIGAGFESTTYNCAISDSYFENITDTYLRFTSDIESCRLSNNYFNFVNNPSAYLLDYLPGPNNNFIIEDDNTFIDFSDNQFFKTVDSTIGYNMGRITRPKKFSYSIDDFLVNNVNFPKSTNVIQPLEQFGLKTHQVNNFADGIYAGRFTDGYTRSNGFEYIDTGTSDMEIRTVITPSDTQRIYVNIRVSASGLFIIRGEFIGNDFYEYTATTQQKTSELSISVVGGFVHITGSQAATVTNVVGEVRLV